MKLRFIVGRAGTGKTRYIIDSISKSVAAQPGGPPIILLVPEQATFQLEYSLAKALGGSIRAQVLSFRRLAYRVLLECGGAARVPIGELGKRMILRNLLERHKSSLRIFARSCQRPGFTECLAHTIGELKTYLISPDHLDQACQLLHDSVLLRDKLADTGLLYRELEAYLANRYTDPDDYLTLLAEKLTCSGAFREAEFWVDGFKGFTPQETLVLQQLCTKTAGVNIALSLDDRSLTGELAQDHFFYPTWKTYRDMLDTAQTKGIPVQPPIVLHPDIPYRFSQSPALAHLEKTFFNYPAETYHSPGENIRLVAAGGRRAEVEACAREMIYLAREKGYRWRDMAVMLRDLEPYHELIGMVFNDYEIPYFIDRKYPVMHHPLVELLRSALETISRNWVYEPVFRYLKTDLVIPDREKVFLLENYVLAHGIRGRRWTDGADWTFRRHYTLGEDCQTTGQEATLLETVNEARKDAGTALAAFGNKISRAASVRQYTEALFELMETLEVGVKLDHWKAAAEGAGRLAEGREHAQILAKVTGLLDEVVEALGDEEMDLDTYSGILDAGFETLNLGLIPPGLDQVVIGSLDRSRNPELKAAFILGVNEGTFPARPQDTGIFNDTEREKLGLSGINLAPGSRKRVFEEQFLVYTALTRASESVWLSYPAADDDGRSLAPSQVISRVKEIFPTISEDIQQVEPVTGSPGDHADFIIHPGRALAYLTGKLREAKAGSPIPPVWWELYNIFVTGDWQDQAAPLLNSVFHHNLEPYISRETSRRLFGNPVRASVSRLEKFRACPFAHFSLYGLKLKERNIYRLETPDMGELFHAALKAFGQHLHQESLDWGQLSADQCLDLSEKIVNQLAPQLQSEILLSTARYRYLTGKLKKHVDRAVLTLAEHARRSQFRPVAFELSFGPDGELPPIRLNLPGGETLELSGRIDRLDIARKDGAVYIRIIDYKSSANNIRPEDIYQGLKLQLLAYLHVALTNYSQLLHEGGPDITARPAGILYFTVKDPLISGSGPMSREEVERAVLAQLKMKGLVLAERDVFQMMDGSVENGRSELFPIRLKTNGDFYSNAPVIEESRFDQLRKHLERILTDSGDRIVRGTVSIEPQRHNLDIACRFCSFKTVCKFDPLLEGNKYRTLKPITSAEVWQTLTREEGTNECQPMD